MYKYSRVQDNSIYSTDIPVIQSEEFVLWFINTSSRGSFAMKIVHSVVLKERKKFSFDEQITTTHNKIFQVLFEEWTGDTRAPFFPPALGFNISRSCMSLGICSSFSKHCWWVLLGFLPLSTWIRGNVVMCLWARACVCTFGLLHTCVQLDGGGSVDLAPTSTRGLRRGGWKSRGAAPQPRAHGFLLWPRAGTPHPHSPGPTGPGSLLTCPSSLSCNKRI